MAKRGLWARVGRALAVGLIGGSLFQAGGCDPLVRDTLLTGLETTAGTLAQTFITAFFVSLQDDETSSSTTLTTTGTTTP